MKVHKLMMAVLAAAALAACSAHDEPPPPAAKQGRAETQGIRNVQAIGVPGNAIADKVDGALNASDDQRKRTDQALQNVDKTQPDPQ